MTTQKKPTTIERISALRDIMPGLGLNEARDMVEANLDQQLGRYVHMVMKDAENRGYQNFHRERMWDTPNARDEYAMRALEQLLAHGPITEEQANTLPTVAVRLADGLLAALKNKETR